MTTTQRVLALGTVTSNTSAGRPVAAKVIFGRPGSSRRLETVAEMVVRISKIATHQNCFICILIPSNRF